MLDFRAIRRATAACTLALSLTGTQAVGAAVADTGRDASAGVTQPAAGQRGAAPRAVGAAPTPPRVGSADEGPTLQEELAAVLAEQQLIRAEIKANSRPAFTSTGIPFAKLTNLALRLKSLQEQRMKLEGLLAPQETDCRGLGCDEMWGF